MSMKDIYSVRFTQQEQDTIKRLMDSESKRDRKREIDSMSIEEAEERAQGCVTIDLDRFKYDKSLIDGECSDRDDIKRLES